MEVASEHIINEFKRYQTNRERCLQHTIDYLPRMNNVESIDKAGTVELFRAILLDPIPALHETAVVGLARFASINEDFALYLVSVDIIQVLIGMMKGRHHRFQSAVLYVIRSASKHSSTSAQSVVDAGGLKCIATSLNDVDPRIIQSAARAVINLGKHSRSLTAQVLRADQCVFTLVNGLRHGCVPFKLYCATALAEMSIHSASITDTLMETNLACVIKCIEMEHLPHKILALTTLVSLCKYNAQIVNRMMCHDFIPYVIQMMRFPDETVRKVATRVIEEVTKFTEDLCLYVANNNGMMALIQMVVMNPSNISISAMNALGNLAELSPDLAMRLIRTNAVHHLTHLFTCESDSKILFQILYTLKQMAKHSPEHAKTVLNLSTFRMLLHKYEDTTSDQKLRTSCKEVLKQSIQKCLDIQVLIPLLDNVPERIFRYVLNQIILTISHDACAKRAFVKTEAFKLIQEFEPKPDSKLAESTKIINDLFPEPILSYYNDDEDDFDIFHGQTEENEPEITPIFFQINSIEEEKQEEDKTEEEHKPEEGCNAGEELKVEA